MRYPMGRKSRMSAFSKLIWNLEEQPDRIFRITAEEHSSVGPRKFFETYFLVLWGFMSTTSAEKIAPVLHKNVHSQHSTLTRVVPQRESILMLLQSIFQFDLKAHKVAAKIIRTIHKVDFYVSDTVEKLDNSVIKKSKERSIVS